MTTKKAVVAGHICLDVLPDMSHLPAGQFEALFRPGHLITVGESIFATGGAVPNVGLTLHHLGIATRLVASIGNDPYGAIVKDIIRQHATSLLEGIRTDERDVTSFSIIISPPGTDRIFLHCPGVNDSFDQSSIDFELVADSDLMHFGYPPLMRQMYQADGAHLVSIFQQARATGVTTSLDMAFPDPSSDAGKANWRKILESVLPYVDIFMPSVEETLHMLRWNQFQEMAAQYPDVLEALTPELLMELSGELLNMGTRMVVLKLGHRGLYVRTSNVAALKDMGRAAPVNLDAWADQVLWSPCFKVDVVGTTGAGDSTNAGFLCGLLRGLSPQETVNLAVAVGACNVEAPDALGGLRSWEATTARIHSQWQKHPLNIQLSGWEWDDVHALWSRPTDAD